MGDGWGGDLGRGGGRDHVLVFWALISVLAATKMVVVFVLVLVLVMVWCIVVVVCGHWIHVS